MKQPVKPGVRELIIEYFKCDLLDRETMASDMKANLVQTFTYAYDRHLSIHAITKELQNSDISEYRDRLIKRMGSNYNPFPIRLGDIKPDMQAEAAAMNRSLHSYILMLLRGRNEFMSVKRRPHVVHIHVEQLTINFIFV